MFLGFFASFTLHQVLSESVCFFKIGVKIGVNKISNNLVDRSANNWTEYLPVFPNSTGQKSSAMPASPTYFDLHSRKNILRLWSSYFLNALLAPILEMIKKHLPEIEYIYGATRVTDIRNKTVDQLKRLKEMGLREISLGVESGDDWTLNRVNKGYHAEDIYEQCGKLSEAGIDFWMKQTGASSLPFLKRNC